MLHILRGPMLEVKVFLHAGLYYASFLRVFSRCYTPWHQAVWKSITVHPFWASTIQVGQN